MLFFRRIQLSEPMEMAIESNMASPTLSAIKLYMHIAERFLIKGQKKLGALSGKF